MAEGGVKQQGQGPFLTSGSEFVYDFYCEHCRDDGLNVEADGFCVDCEDYLCKTCIHAHRKSRPTRHHDLLDQYVMPKDTPLSNDRISKDISTKCKLHRNKTVEFYCKFHDTLCCSTCFVTGHRTCPNIESIFDKSKHILDSLEYKDMITRLNDMEQKSRDMIFKTRKDVTTTEQNHSGALDQIRKLREEVMAHFDALEQDLVTELESFTSKDKEIMEKMEKELIKFAKEVDQLKTEVENLANSKRVCQLFIQIKTKQTVMSILEGNMRKIEGEHIYGKVYMFEPDDEIRNVLTATGLGKIVVQDGQSGEAETSVAEDRRNITDITTEHVSDIDTRYTGDRIKRAPRLGLVDCNPRSIDQTDKEVERDVHEKFPMTQPTQLSKNQSSRSGGGGRGRRPPPSQVGGVGAANCVWNTVGGGKTTPFRPVDRHIDPSNKWFSKQNVDASNIQLCPGGGASRFAGWGRGSTGGTSGDAAGGRSNKEKEKTNTPANSFTVLKKSEEKSGRRLSGTSPARGNWSGRGGSGRPPSRIGGSSSDEWNTSGGSVSTPLESVNRSIDTPNIWFTKPNVNNSNIQLDPGGEAVRFAGWDRDSTDGTTYQHTKVKQKPNAPAYSFSVLNKPEEDSSRRYAGSSPARGDSLGCDWFDHPPSLANRHSQETEREKAVSAAKAIGVRPSAKAPRQTGRGREAEVAENRPVPAVPVAKESTSEEMEKKTDSILDTFLDKQDLKEVILCVEELSPNNHHHFVYHAINHVIERSQAARQNTGHLLHDLVKRQVISSFAYIKGLLEVLEFAEDMEIDIPMIWQYYGELISPMIQDGSIRLSFLKEVCLPLLASNKAGVLLAMVLNDASQREGHKKVADLWAESGLQWSEFVPKSQMGGFLKYFNPEFTKSGGSPLTKPTTGLPLTEIADKLHQLIVVQAADNETVFDWIESNVDKPTTKQVVFIRVLMTAVCNSAIKGDTGKERVEPKEIIIRNDLLQKYLDHQPDSELQALYALQLLVAKLGHPQGILEQMFDTLYDEDLISEDAFLQWKKSEEEPEEKGDALKQVVEFIQYLQEREDDN